MRADIHDGPEHNTLQSKAGYIDARPLTASSAKSTCNARPDHTYGSCVDGAHGSRDSFGFLLAVGCKSCVRPVCAVPMTAGPDVIRRSSPYQSLALKSACRVARRNLTPGRSQIRA